MKFRMEKRGRKEILFTMDGEEYKEAFVLFFFMSVILEVTL